MNRYLITTCFLFCFFLATPPKIIAGGKGAASLNKNALPSVTIMTSVFRLTARRCHTDGRLEGIMMTKYDKPGQYIEAKNAHWEMDEEDGLIILLKDVVLIELSKSPRNTFNSIVKYENLKVKPGKNPIQLILKIHGKGNRMRLVKGKEALIHDSKLWFLQGIVLEMDENFFPEGHPRHFKRMAFSAFVDNDSSQIRENSWAK